MKTIFRTLGMGAALSVVMAFGAVVSFAQDACDDTDGQAALRKTFTDNYSAKTPEGLQKAVDAGKGFIEKYGACEDQKAYVDYLNQYLPGMEKRIVDMIAVNAEKELFGRFDKAAKDKNWANLFAVGKEVMAKNPEMVKVPISLTVAGYDLAYKKDNTHNEDTLRNARLALQLLEKNTQTDTYGLGLLNADLGSKENATAWMNFVIGWITAYSKNDVKGSLPFMYKASQIAGDPKSNPVTYQTIGNFYKAEAATLVNELRALATAQKEDDTPEVRAASEAKIKEKEALMNAYAERAMDAYGRAHKLVKSDAASKAYKDGLYAEITALYKVRFQKESGISEYLTAELAKPMPDPSSPVTPIPSTEKPADAATTGATAGKADAAKPAAAKASSATTGAKTSTTGARQPK